MTLEISIETHGAPEGIESAMERVARRCAEMEGVLNARADVRIVDDEAIRTINREQRGIDRATDVLSFPSVTYRQGTARDNLRRLRREYDPGTGRVFLGDIVLSMETALSQAKEYGHGAAREISYLTAHAMFHLLGYDHEREEDKRVMREMEEAALSHENELFARACEALAFAYAPYSKFRVGACVLAEDGAMYLGCNIENASYGLTICAERAAVCNAVSHGVRRIVAIAVAAEKETPWPCGACRQVLNEFGADMLVICGAIGGEVQSVRLGELLPHAFTLE